MKLYLLILLIGLSGCITSSVMKGVKNDRKNDRVAGIQSMYTDSAGVATINFTARMDGHRKSPYHVSAPIDSLAAIVCRNRIVDSIIGKEYKVNRIFSAEVGEDSLRKTGLCIELKREALVKGYLLPPHGTMAKGKLVDCSKLHNFDNGALNTKADSLRPNSRHPIFAYYYAKGDSIYGFSDDNFIALSVEPSPRRRYSRYALLPLTVVGDIATSPFQAIGFAAMALVAGTIGM